MRFNHMVGGNGGAEPRFSISLTNESRPRVWEHADYRQVGYGMTCYLTVRVTKDYPSRLYLF